MQQVEEKIIYSYTRQDWIDRAAQSIQNVVNGWFRGGEVGLRVKDFLNGVWLAHPLHPAVTDVPVGAWTAAVAMDGIQAATGRDMRGATATTISVGIVGAVASAASGVADWADTRQEQRRVGLVHATVNVVGLTLMGASLWRRTRVNSSGAGVLSSAGYLTMVVGAYLGGDLAYRLGNQIDRNAWVRGSKQFTPVMREIDLPPEKPTRVEAGGVPILLVRHNDQIHAMNETCSHAGGPLSEGHLEGDAIVCPWHGSQYRLEDGTVVHGPSPYAQPHYEVRVRDGQIEVCTTLQ
jgi:nitrite reductase/ring-hydroxylating ferredoxin subunit/uncharacterized membrane protein